jgi:zinc-binding in reverse transcriptase
LGASLDLRREKAELLIILTNLSLDPTKSDTVVWGLLGIGLFIVHSMYLFLNFRGVKVLVVGSVWNLKITLKIKIFIWLALERRVLTKNALLRRGWSESASCVFCSNLEIFDHIFFTLFF